jgi:N-acetylmuramoyl-L-alanine amidase
MIYVVLRDAGHGLETSGKRTPKIKSLGRSIHENEFNEPVSKYFEDELKRHGVIVHDISPTTKDVPLKARTDEANRLLNHYINKYGAGNVRVVLVSFHFNAYDGSFEGANPSGISVHVQPGSDYARELAESVGKYLRQGTNQVWRGIVEQNLHMTREFQGVGILTENGFMDNSAEASLMLDKNFQREVARETAKGVLEYFNLIYKPTSTNVTKNEADSADGKLIRGEIGPNVKLLNNMLNTLEYTRKTDDLFDQYTEAALIAFQKDYGLKQDGIYTTAVGRSLVKAIKHKQLLKNPTDIPEKDPAKYRLAKLVDTGNPELIEKLLKEGYEVLEAPRK